MAKTFYRKKPVTVEAYPWFRNGDHPDDYVDKDIPEIEGDKVKIIDGVEITYSTFTAEYQRAQDWEGDVVRRFRHPDVPGTETHDDCGRTWHEHGWIDTLEGGHNVCPSDYIITGVEGERYPCKARIFEATYELVEGPDA